MSHDQTHPLPLYDHDDEDAKLWREEDGSVWGDHPLPFQVTVTPAPLIRPLVLDLHHALKRHSLIFGFYSRAVFVTEDGAKMHGQRYFHFNEPTPPPFGKELDADKLFVSQHGIEDHIKRGLDLGKQYPGSYFHASWQARPLLEASAREVERVYGAVLAGKDRNWQDHAEVRRAARFVRPAFLEHDDWTFTRKVEFGYPDSIRQQIERVAAIALAELEPKYRDREAEREEASRVPHLPLTPNESLPGTGGSEIGRLPHKVIEHSDDFRSATWYGLTFRFTSAQATVVKLLWAEWEKHPGMGLGEANIGETIDSAAERFRLSHVFRQRDEEGKWVKHPALGSMIVTPEKGFYCLAEPNHQKITDKPTG